MNSMTGYGRGTARRGGVFAEVECSSVNRKSAEVVWNAPRELLALESRARELVMARVARGRVTVGVTVTMDSEAGGLIDRARARAYAASLRKLSRDLGLEGGLRIETVLAGPGVLRAGLGSGDAWPAIHTALEAALDQLLLARAAEGARLEKSLRRDSVRLAALVRKVRPLAARVPARHRTRLLERIASIASPDDPRVATEVALFAERCDITEELDRLDSHAAELDRLLDAGGPTGRHLEFIAQEMGREWNTLGNKAADAAISRLVVAAKSALDKLREQLANIE